MVLLPAVLYCATLAIVELFTSSHSAVPNTLFIQTYYFHSAFGLVVWLSGNALVVINEVTLRQARLILGWVTVCGQVHHLSM